MTSYKSNFGLIFTLITIFSIFCNYYSRILTVCEHEPSNFNLDYRPRQKILLVLGHSNFNIQMQRVALANYYLDVKTRLVLNSAFVSIIDDYFDYMSYILPTYYINDTLQYFHQVYLNDTYLRTCKLDIIIISSLIDKDDIVLANMNYTNNNITLIFVN